MSAYAYFARHLAYPAFDLLRGRRLCRRMDELAVSQWWSPAQVREMQLNKLRQLLAHAGQHVPYYSQVFAEHGFDPAAVTSLEDVRALPILTKEIIKARKDDLVATNYPRTALVAGRTGGSTGVPTHFYLNIEALDVIRAAVLRNLDWAGLPLGEKYVKVSGSHFDYSLSQQRIVKLIQWLLRQRRISAVDLTEAAMREAVELIRRFQPRALWGYASAIHHLAAFMDAQHLAAPVHTVITSSDTLFPEQRALIERVFGCKVFDAYGSRETSIAAECDRHRGMHINAEVVYLETVTPSGEPCAPGERGRLLVTDLHNYGFPFIRYEIGDVGVLGEGTCSCGRGLPMLESLEGRVEDFIVTPSGVWLSPPAFTILFSDVNAIKEYQLVQREPGRVDVLISRDAHYTAEDERHITGGLRTLLGEGMTFDVRYVDGIDRGESGKRRVVISTLHHANASRVEATLSR